MKRHMDKKSIYEVPEAEVISVRFERHVLDTTDSYTLVNYDEEDI